MRKSCILHIRVTPELKKKIKAEAKKRDRTTSDFAFLILEGALAEVVS